MSLWEQALPGLTCSVLRPARRPPLRLSPSELKSRGRLMREFMVGHGCRPLITLQWWIGCELHLLIVLRNVKLGKTTLNIPRIDSHDGNEIHSICSWGVWPRLLYYCCCWKLNHQQPALSPSHHFNLRLFIYGHQTIQEWADVQREHLISRYYLSGIKTIIQGFFSCAVAVYLYI